MALFRYFKPKEKQENRFLPDPTGPLSVVVPSSTIDAANKAVKRVLDDGERSCTQKRARGQYETFPAKEKATIARYASEIGVTKAIRKQEKQYSGSQLKESTVRAWAKKYKAELHERCKAKTADGKPLDELEDKKRVRPLLLGNNGMIK